MYGKYPLLPEAVSEPLIQHRDIDRAEPSAGADEK